MLRVKYAHTRTQTRIHLQIAWMVYNVAHSHNQDICIIHWDHLFGHCVCVRVFGDTKMDESITIYDLWRPVICVCTYHNSAKHIIFTRFLFPFVMVDFITSALDNCHLKITDCLQMNNVVALWLNHFINGDLPLQQRCCWWRCSCVCMSFFLLYGKSSISRATSWFRIKFRINMNIHIEIGMEHTGKWN